MEGEGDAHQILPPPSCQKLHIHLHWNGLCCCCRKFCIQSSPILPIHPLPGKAVTSWKLKQTILRQLCLRSITRAAWWKHTRQQRSESPSQGNQFLSRMENIENREVLRGACQGSRWMGIFFLESMVNTHEGQWHWQCTMDQALKKIGIKDFVKNDYLCSHFLNSELFQMKIFGC